MKKHIIHIIIFCIALITLQGNTANAANRLKYNSDTIQNSGSLLFPHQALDRAWQSHSGTKNNEIVLFSNQITGEFAWCGQANSDPPWSSNYGNTIQASLYNDPIRDSRANYITQKFHTNNGSIDSFDTAAIQLALWRNEGNNDIRVNELLNAQTDFNKENLEYKAQEILETAENYRGPYRTAVKIEYTNGNISGHIKVGLLSSRGNLVPNIPVNIKLFGESGARFNNNQAHLSTNTANEMQIIPFTVSASGTLKAEFDFMDIPSELPLIQIPEIPTAQTLIITEQTNKTTISDALSHPPVELDFSLSVQTKTSSFLAEKGSSINDKLIVSLIENSWLNDITGNPTNILIESTLWGPFASKPKLSNSVPSGAPSVGKVTTTVDREGEHWTPHLTLSESGYYVWTEKIAPIPGVVKGWQSKFGITEETTLIKWTPKVETQTSTQIAKRGEQIHDRICVTGNQPGKILNVESTLWGPLDQKPTLSDSIPTGIPTLGKVSTQVTGNECAYTAPILLEKSGFYVWTETIAETETTKPWTSQFGVANETTLVKWTPVVQTQTSDLVVTPGVEIYDRICVTGNQPEKALDVNSTLWGEFLNRPTLQNEAPTGSPIAGRVTTQVTGDECVDSDSVALNKRGFYTWTETIGETDTTDPWVSQFGIEDETTIAQWEIFIASTISDQIAVKNGKVADTLYMLGFPGNHGSPAAPNFGLPGDEAWNVRAVPPIFQNPNDWQRGLRDNFDLTGENTPDRIWVDADMYFVPYRPEQTSDIPAEAIFVGSQQVPAYDGQFLTPNFPQFEELEGCYTIVAHFDGSYRVAAFTSDFGIESETTCTHEVPPAPNPSQPQVITKTSSEVVQAGDAIFDTMVVTNVPKNTTLEVESTLYMLDKRPAPSNSIPEDAKAIESITTEVDRAGSFETDTVTIPEDIPEGSWLIWHETIAATKNTLEWNGQFGITTEIGFKNTTTPPTPEENYTPPEIPQAISNTGTRNNNINLLLISFLFQSCALIFIYLKKYYTN